MSRRLSLKEVVVTLPHFHPSICVIFLLLITLQNSCVCSLPTLLSFLPSFLLFCILPLPILNKQNTGLKTEPINVQKQKICVILSYFSPIEHYNEIQVYKYNGMPITVTPKAAFTLHYTCASSKHKRFKGGWVVMVWLNPRSM